MDAAIAYQAFDQTPEAPLAFLAWLAARSGMSGAVRILDVGCGPGRLLVPLRELGWTVTGIEPHPDYFQEAQKAALQRSGITVRQGGLLDLEEHAAYDVIACMNDPFQYLLAPITRREGLVRVFRALVPGGVVVLDMANFVYILRHYKSPLPVTIPFQGGQLTRTILHTIDFHHARFTHTDQFHYVDAEGQVTDIETTHPLAIVTLPEVTQLLFEVGFLEPETYPSLVSRAEGPLQGARMVIVAAKPKPPNNRLKQSAGASGRS